MIMQKNKMKKLTLVTTLLTLAPMLLGIMVYSQLPAKIAIHFGVDNEPNGWANRPLAVFGIPVLMALVQLFIMWTSTRSSRINGGSRRMEMVTIAIVPILTVVLYIITIALALGAKVDVGRIAMFVVAITFIALGNYIPTVTYEQQTAMRPFRIMRNQKNWGLVSRMTGYVMVFGGLLVVISLFISPVLAAVVLGIVVVIMLSVSIYGSLKK